VDRHLRLDPRLLVIGILLLTLSSAAATNQDFAWRTGPALRAQLEQQITYAGADVPLRDMLKSFSTSQQVAILLDRRIDPSEKLDVTLDGLSLRQALEQIAAGRDAAITVAGPVVYFGPASSARRLRTLISLREAEIARLPSAARRRFQQPRPWSWDDLATPRDLLTALAHEAGMQLIGLDQVPHDLWTGAELPPLSIAERFSLVAAQFDLTFQIGADGNEATLVPIPPDVAIERSYAAGKRAAERAQQWSRLCPDCRIKVQGDRIVVRGLLEDHERIAPPATAPPPRPASAGEQRYTLTVQEQPIGRLIEALGRQLKLEIRLDQPAITQAGISLDQRVSFKVNQATLDALLEAALKPAGLTHRKEGSAIVVMPRE